MDKYSIVELIKESNFGITLKCRLLKANEFVFIKKYDNIKTYISVLKSAIGEIKLLKKARHENIVAFNEVFKLGTSLCLVFEFVNSTLYQVMASGRLNNELVKGFSLQILRGLSFLHNLRIIFRDLKPDNILVTSGGVIKLSDFGVAKYMLMIEEPLDDFVSSRWYRAPELLLEDKEYDESIDIWALGCIVMEMASEEPLFPGDSDLEQLALIIKYCGNLTEKQKSSFDILFAPEMTEHDLDMMLMEPDFSFVYLLWCKYPESDRKAIVFTYCCLRMDPTKRFTSDELLSHEYFTDGSFSVNYLAELRDIINKENRRNELVNKYCCQFENEKEMESSLNYINQVLLLPKKRGKSWMSGKMQVGAATTRQFVKLK